VLPTSFAISRELRLTEEGMEIPGFGLDALQVGATDPAASAMSIGDEHRR